jgi:hypothetical protein
MYLTRHQTAQGPRWARDGYFLPLSLSLSFLLELRRSAMVELLTAPAVTAGFDNPAGAKSEVISLRRLSGAYAG